MSATQTGQTSETANRRLLPKPVKDAGVRLFRDVLADVVLSKPAELPSFAEPISLHLLMSNATRQMGLLALRSYEWSTGFRWETFIHDDGTLTSPDLEKIAQVAPYATIVRRTDADKLAAELLKAHPQCASNRMKHNWFLKFFDCCFHAPHPNYIVLDTDVIFYRKPDEILDWCRNKPGSCHYMKDARETYCSPRSEILERVGLDLWEAVNSGICLMPKSAVDLDLSERFLAEFAENARHYIFLEQTLFAVAGAALGRGGTLPETYEISWKTLRRKDGIARHYVGIIKHDLLYAEGVTTLLARLPFRRRENS
jgi:hypothetical protein